MLNKASKRKVQIAMNERIYVNQDGTEFIEAYNARDYQELLLNDLKKQVHFLPAKDVNEQKEQEDNLTEIILSLPLNDQIELANKLRVFRFCDIPAFDLNGARAEYQRLLAEDDEVDSDFGEDEFLDEFHTGQEGRLIGIDQMFQHYTLSELGMILDFLRSHLDDNHWRSWLVAGPHSEQIALAWAYNPEKDLDYLDRYRNDDGKANFAGENISRKLGNLLFGNLIMLVSCDKSGIPEGRGKINRYLAGYYVDKPYSETSDLDDYMKNTYNFKPAKVKKTYYA